MGELAATRSPWSKRGAHLVHRFGQMVYIAIGVMLVVALLIALASAARLLWSGFADLADSESIVHTIDRLLFVLMLVEILHAVHASMRTGSLVCEPFLVVGLVACIRRILVLTPETSQVTRPGRWQEGSASLFHAAMIELGVLAGLIVVLVGAIRVVRIGRTPRADQGWEEHPVPVQGSGTSAHPHQDLPPARPRTGGSSLPPLLRRKVIRAVPFWQPTARRRVVPPFRPRLPASLQ